MANHQILPNLPPIDSSQTQQSIENLSWWIQNFILVFPNAVGQAVDPSPTGQAATFSPGRDGSLTIVSAPTGVTYTPATDGSDGTGALVGHVDVTFTLPARAFDCVVEYREAGTTNYERLYFTTSPVRVLGLKVGVTYNFRVAGSAANEYVGPFTSASDVVISPNLAVAPTAPTGVAAAAYPQEITVSWTPHGDLTVKYYEIDRADDAGFTVNLVTYQAFINFFVDVHAGQGVTRYYRVRAVRASGQASANSATVSATTTGTNTGELVDDSVSTMTSDTSAGPTGATSGTEVDLVDVTISTDGGYTLVFASTNVTLNDNESYLLQIYKGDSATGTIIASGRYPAATGTTVLTSGTLVAIDPSPGASQEYTATFTPTSGGSRNATNSLIVVINLKK